MIIVNAILIILGFVFFGLGAVGAAIPVLPTVPFLLVSAVCFTKGSKRFEKWFMETKLYKRYLEDFLKHKSLTLKNKFLYTSIAAVMFSITFILVNNIAVRILILALVVFMYYYFICKIKTINKRDL